MGLGEQRVTATFYKAVLMDVLLVTSGFTKDAFRQIAVSNLVHGAMNLLLGAAAPLLHCYNLILQGMSFPTPLHTQHVRHHGKRDLGRGLAA